MFTILVVDDDEMILGLCKCVLASIPDSGVLTARCGSEALNVAAACGKAIDLLVCDISMPGELDGVAVAATLEEQQPAIRVLLMSGYSHDGLALRPGWRFLAKPFEIADLRAHAEDAVGAPLWRAPARRTAPVVQGS